MKRICLKYSCCFLFFITQFLAKSQDNSRTELKSMFNTNVSPKLNQFVWSYANANVRKDNKPQLNFETLDNWPSLSEYLSVSNNGEYFAYSTLKGPNDWKQQDSLIVQSTKSNWRTAFKTSMPGFFSGDSKLYVFQTGSKLYFLHNGSSNIEITNDVLYYKTPLDNSKFWIAYLLKDNILVLRNLLTGIERKVDNVAAFDFDKANKLLACETNLPEKKLVLFNLNTGKEQTFANVKSYLISPGGNKLLINTGAELQYININDQTTHTIYNINNTSDIISGCQFDHSEKQVIFMVKGNTNSLPQNTVWYYKEGMHASVVKANQQTTGLIPGAEIQSAVFTDNGQYIKLDQLQQPKLQTPVSDIAKLDVWSYKDTYLQSAQIIALSKSENYIAIISTTDGRVKLLDKPEQLYLLQGDHAVIKKSGTSKYGNRFWEIVDNYNEDSLWLISLIDGKRHFIPNLGKYPSLWFSPENHYLVYFDVKTLDYFSYDLRTRKTTNISTGIPAGQLGFVNEYVRNNKPPKLPCGLAAWLVNDAGILVYDNKDIWQLNLNSKTPAINITNGYGFKNNIMLRLFTDDRNVPVLKNNESLLIRAFNNIRETNGFYRKQLGTAGNPLLLSMGDWFMYFMKGCQDGNVTNNMGLKPVKAGQAELWIVQRQSIADAPNYYATKDFKSFNRRTNLQPQQGYKWITQELHTYKHLKGQTGQGILYKPEDFDPSKKYPVLIVFYGGYSGNMHQFPNPYYNYRAITPGESPVWFTNNDYLVFTPDIYVEPLKYGPEAYNVIEGAANYLKSLPYVDASGLGCASHSYSAKLGAYLFTHSKSFGAMTISEGFLYGNMINVALSNEANGNSKLEVVENGFEFGNLWENRDSWIDHTTVLNAHKANSPLLLFCNKESSQEYQNQTQQLFSALWRLEKKAWWLKYDKGGHNLTNLDEMKDYTIRYTQYFDHYLKKSPAPKWMTQGVPAALKGIEARYELDPSGSCGKDCQICKKWNEQYKRIPDMFTKPIKEWKLDHVSETIK